MTSPQGLADQILRDCQRLNEQLRQSMNSIGLEESRNLERTCREAEGWLMGCRKMIE